MLGEPLLSATKEFLAEQSAANVRCVRAFNDINCVFPNWALGDNNSQAKIIDILADRGIDTRPSQQIEQRDNLLFNILACSTLRYWPGPKC